MTPALALLLAATISGTDPDSGRMGVAQRDSLVYGYAPLWKADGSGCCADSTRPSRVGAVVLYAVGQQAKAWRTGCAAIPGCMDSVRVQAAPVQEQSQGVSAGQRFAFTVPVDSLSRFVLSHWPLGGDPKGPWGTSWCWGRVVRP